MAGYQPRRSSDRDPLPALLNELSVTQQVTPGSLVAIHEPAADLAGDCAPSDKRTGPAKRQPIFNYVIKS